MAPVLIITLTPAKANRIVTASQAARPTAYPVSFVALSNWSNRRFARATFSSSTSGSYSTSNCAKRSRLNPHARQNF